MGCVSHIGFCVIYEINEIQNQFLEIPCNETHCSVSNSFFPPSAILIAGPNYNGRLKEVAYRGGWFGGVQPPPQISKF
jgi:hypothetical protein